MWISAICQEEPGIFRGKVPGGHGRRQGKKRGIMQPAYCFRPDGHCIIGENQRVIVEGAPSTPQDVLREILRRGNLYEI